MDSVLAQAKSYARQATEASKEILNSFKEQLEEQECQEIVIEIQED